jgi:hypothetical protein
MLAALGLAADDWKFVAVRLKNGQVFVGLLIEEKPGEIRFHCVRRHPGSPTVVVATTFQRPEIASIVRLSSHDRDVLAARLRGLDPTGAGESLQMESLPLQAVPWIGKNPGEALQYTSSHFVLVSNAREDIVRRAAVRLEQIYGAYARFLPPRRQAAKSTRILLVRSLAEYHALRAEEGRNALHPAFYDAVRNEIICASDVQHLGDQLEEIRTRHRQDLAELSQLEADLTKQYQGKIPRSILRDSILRPREKIRQKNKHNDRVFTDCTRHLFRTLYHEAFHAYLATFVYPPDEAEVPRWLNEGLAQIFETAILEAGEIRVGHADVERLERLKADGRKGDWLPLSELLKAGPDKFLIAHASDQQISDRYYLYSWGLAFYLAWDCRLLGTAALDRYAQMLKGGAEPAEAFQVLTGKRLPTLERDFHQYVLKLRADGTTGKPTGE